MFCYRNLEPDDILKVNIECSIDRTQSHCSDSEAVTEDV